MGLSSQRHTSWRSAHPHCICELPRTDDDATFIFRESKVSRRLVVQSEMGAAHVNERFKDCGPFLPGIGPSVVGGKQVRFGNVEDLEHAFKSTSDKIAAFMIETVEGNAGTVVPPKGYLTAVRELCTRYNVLLILDEIQCGFGRTGYLMAYDCENIKPDMVVLGKSLTGGAYSMGLTLGSRELISTFKAGQYVECFGFA